jgi:tetratricopeptide (TPR) repeat protein/ssDNA-binding Zn-finger/Zn-ribbon topoisomerase 1
VVEIKNKILGLVVLLGLVACSPDDSATVEQGKDVNHHQAVKQAADYVGRDQCATCHSEQNTLWEASHHDLAMQEATPETVLGTFDNTIFSHNGVVTRFYKEGERFLVETEDASGESGTFEVRYTFGVTPLQQYLLDYKDGRLQALGVAWDARPTEQGGQRWFHLYPDAPPVPGDSIHWTGIDQTWNYQCAECHSTNLKKNYNPDTQSYDTQWSEINVACEACHGPGSRHVGWANKEAGWEQMNDSGLDVLFDARKGAAWSMVEKASSASRSQPIAHQHEVETCARCHSRRGVVSEAYEYGQPIHDTHRVSRLSAGLYYPDGQIRDEVYVYGSFIQSKMFHEGVTCSDCHEPHSLKLRAEGNGVCLQCHSPQSYESKRHHFHPEDSGGGRCVACHMPETTYMVVDPRRDHSMRIPRPDLSVKLGVPNACTQCHQDQSNEWAAEKVLDWYGDLPEGYQDYVETLYEARRGNPQSLGELERLLNDAQTPAIARASLVSELPRFASPQASILLLAALKDADPMVRQAAVEALDNAELSVKFQHLFPLLGDPVRSVRIETARSLLNLPTELMTSRQKGLLDAAIEELEVSLLLNADRPESQLAMASMNIQRGNLQAAQSHYQRALELDPGFIPAMINWADLLSQRGKEAEAMELLKSGLKRSPGNADLSHALGLSLIRQKDYPRAMEALKVAAESAPENARYSYVYGVALEGTASNAAAIEVLEQALQGHPYNAEILSALVTYYRKAGETEKAMEMATRLNALR